MPFGNTVCWRLISGIHLPDHRSLSSFSARRGCLGKWLCILFVRYFNIIAFAYYILHVLVGPDIWCISDALSLIPGAYQFHCRPHHLGVLNASSPGYTLTHAMMQRLPSRCVMQHLLRLPEHWLTLPPACKQSHNEEALLYFSLHILLSELRDLGRAFQLNILYPFLLRILLIV